MSVHNKIAGDLAGFGGVLRCTVCKYEEPVGGPDGIAASLSDGWPRCHGYTMTWVTDRLLAEERAARSEPSRG